MTLGNEYLFGSNRPKHGVAPSVRVRLRTYQIPLIRDAVVIGRTAPIDHVAMAKILRIMSPEPFSSADLRDATVATIFVRKALLRKLSWAIVKKIVLQHVKPLMSKTEIMALNLEVEVALGEYF